MWRPREGPSPVRDRGARPSRTLHMDVASARTEYYARPGALPTVERSSLRQDLFRRDFTINAMAACINPECFGAIADPFGGLRDLDAGSHPGAALAVVRRRPDARPARGALRGALRFPSRALDRGARAPRGRDGAARGGLGRAHPRRSCSRSSTRSPPLPALRSDSRAGRARRACGRRRHPGGGPGGLSRRSRRRGSRRRGARRSSAEADPASLLAALARRGTPRDVRSAGLRLAPARARATAAPRSSCRCTDRRPCARSARSGPCATAASTRCSRAEPETVAGPAGARRRDGAGAVDRYRTVLSKCPRRGQRRRPPGTRLPAVATLRRRARWCRGRADGRAGGGAELNIANLARLAAKAGLEQREPTRGSARTTAQDSLRRTDVGRRGIGPRATRSPLAYAVLRRRRPPRRPPRPEGDPRGLQRADHPRVRDLVRDPRPRRSCSMRSRAGYAAAYLGDTTAKDNRRLSLNPLRHIDPWGTLLMPALLLLVSRASSRSATPSRCRSIRQASAAIASGACSRWPWPVPRPTWRLPSSARWSSACSSSSTR